MQRLIPNPTEAATPVFDGHVSDGARTVALLRARLAAMEGLATPDLDDGENRFLSFTAVAGLSGLADALPWPGLPRHALHEVVAADPAMAAASGFCATLLGALSQRAAMPVLWVTRSLTLYGPGLAALGLNPARLVVVRARRNRDVLWTMEEGLRSAALAAVLGEADDVTLFASRRLQLAAETAGVTGFLLRRSRSPSQTPPPSAAVTRWRIAPAPAPTDQSIAVPRWHVELLRCRGGRPGHWLTDHQP